MAAAEAAARHAHAEAQAHRTERYDVAKERVDALRAQLGLPRLPNIEEDIDASVARYLEERRREVMRPVKPSPPPAAPTAANRPAAGKASRGRGRGR